MGSDLSSQLNKAVLIVALKSLVSDAEEQTVLHLTTGESEGLIAIKQNKTIVAARMSNFEGTSIQALRKLLPITEGVLKEEHAFPSDLKQDLNIDIKKLLNDLQAASDKAKKPAAATEANAAASASATETKLKESAAVSATKIPAVAKPTEPLLKQGSQDSSSITPPSTPKPVLVPNSAPASKPPVQDSTFVAVKSRAIDLEPSTTGGELPASKVLTELKQETSRDADREIEEAPQTVTDQAAPSNEKDADAAEPEAAEPAAGAESVATTDISESSTTQATFEDDVQDYKHEVSYEASQYDPEVESLMRQPDAPSVGKNSPSSKVGQIAVTSLIKRKKGENTGSIVPIDTSGQSESEPTDAPAKSGAAYDLSALNSIPDPNIKAANVNPPEKVKTESAKVRSLSNLDESEETRKAKARASERKQNLQKNKFKILGGVAAVCVAVGGFYLWHNLAESSLASKIEQSFDNNKMEDTQTLVAQGLQQFPHIPKYHFFRGRMLAREGKMKEAVDEYEIALAPNAEPYNLRYVAFEGKSYVALGEFQKALVCLNRVLEFPVKDHSSYINRCVALMATGNFPGAVADAKRAVELDPSNPNYHSTLAVAYNLNKNYKESIKEWAWVLAKDPKSVAAYVGRANAESSSGQTALALKDFSKSIALKPNAGAYYSRGMLYSMQKNYKAAIEDFNSALQYEPKNSLYLSSLAKTYTTSGDPKKGMAVYQKLAAASPENTSPEVLLDRINTEITSGKFRQAEEDLNLLLAKDPNNIAMRLRHADTAEKAEEFTKALDDYTVLITASPKNSRYYAKRGGLNFRLRHFDQADQDLAKAASLDPKKKNVDLFINRAMLEAEGGHFTEAYADIAYALKLEPNNTTAKKQQLEIQKQKNNK